MSEAAKRTQLHAYSERNHPALSKGSTVQLGPDSSDGPKPQVKQFQPAAATAKDWERMPVTVEKIEDLVFDWKYYPRKEIDGRNVHSYVRALRAGSVFPPVKVGLLAGKKIIVDGVHRVRSRQELSIDTVDCVILPFESEAELFAEAVRLNSEHGHAFSFDEVKDNIRRLKQYKFDVKDIVALTHVPASEIYRESAAPITVLKAPCGKKIYCTGQPDFRELVQFKKALMLIRDVVRSGCIPSDDEFFRDLVRQCREALGKVRFNA